MANNKVIGKGLFLWLSTFSLIGLMVMVTGLWYFISPRLHEFNQALPFVLLSALRIFFLILVIGTILVFLTSVFEKNFLIANFAVKLFIRFMYPICIFVGRIFRIRKEKIGESFVSVNDSLIKALSPKYNASDVLILLPHCLQDTSCPIRITVNPDNCKRCGKCNIGDISKLAEEFGVDIAIATGGTLARRIVLKKKPKLIIAVACYRDLVSGIQDAFPIKTFGILNIRPQGPCINTKVDVQTIREALNKIIMKSDK
ncbi:MAG: DUF116 domain-containing protein [Candidatus Cloacimonadota bacterium]|nr:DUF116 domain-containing protein [Candidatus Cloacimonadota bacterium]